VAGGTSAELASVAHRSIKKKTNFEDIPDFSRPKHVYYPPLACFFLFRYRALYFQDYLKIKTIYLSLTYQVEQ
jgi:hypothetical protein